MPSTPQLLVEFATRHQSHLERLKSGYVKDVMPLLKDMEAMTVARLSRYNITEFSRTRLERELAAVRAAMQSDLSGGIHEVWRRQVIEMASYEAGFEVRNLDSVTINYDFTLPSSRQIESAVFSQPLQVRGPDGGKLLESFYEDWTERQVRAVEGVIRLGYVQGQTTPQIVRSIRDFGGVGEQTQRGFEMMTRTALQHSAHQAKQAVWQANSDIVKKVRIVATLDGRTTTQCQALDGQEFPIDSGPRPPFHIGCRTTTTAALDDRFKLLEEGATRRERDPETGKVGSVPANETYYGWLKRQPMDVQESIIGPTRAKLLNDGGLSAERFAELQLGRNFQPLTLAEMRELDGVAFSRAGI